MEPSAGTAGNIARSAKNVTPAAMDITRCWPIAPYRSHVISIQARRFFSVPGGERPPASSGSSAGAPSSGRRRIPAARKAAPRSPDQSRRCLREPTARRWPPARAVAARHGYLLGTASGCAAVACGAFLPARPAPGLLPRAGQPEVLETDVVEAKGLGDGSTHLRENQPTDAGRDEHRRDRVV